MPNGNMMHKIMVILLILYAVAIYFDRAKDYYGAKNEIKILKERTLDNRLKAYSDAKLLKKALAGLGIINKLCGFVFLCRLCKMNNHDFYQH
jgi:hypothetical protein